MHGRHLTQSLQFNGVPSSELLANTEARSVTTMESLSRKYAGNISDMPVCVEGYINKTPETIKAIAGFVCILSMLGSSCIVLSYVCYKRLRSKAREILVHLSIMDFLSSLSMLVGIVMNFSAHANKNLSNDLSKTYTTLCTIQAAFLVYSNLAALLWTVSVSIYCYFLIMLENSKLAHRSVFGYYLICYGLPLITALWYALTNKLGYSPNRGSGWCTLNLYGKTAREFTVLFGYDVWAAVAIILLPIIAISLILYQRLKNDNNSHDPMDKVVKRVEAKLLAVPIVFIALKFWSFFLNQIHHFRPPCPLFLILLGLGGVGDSAQGFVNSIIFCLFTKKVRDSFILSFRERCTKRVSSEEISPINSTSSQSHPYCT